MKKILLLVFVGLAFFTNAQQSAPLSLKVTWELSENNFNNEFKFRSSFLLENSGKISLPKSGWTMYFNLSRMIDPKSVTGNVEIKHVNGDLYQVKPLAGFQELKKGGKVQIGFVAGDWATNFCDAPSGLFMVLDNNKAQAIPLYQYVIKPFVNEKQLKRFSGDKLGAMTAEIQFQKNQGITSTEVSGIIPKPVKMIQKEGTLILNTPSIYYSNELKSEANYLAKSLEELTGKLPVITAGKAGTAPAISLMLNSGKPESYSLEINEKGIVITGADAAGVFYGIQSLKSLQPGFRWKTKQPELSWKHTSIQDEPRFPYRGMHLDVARNFRSKSDVLRMLELMSFYKLNKFHFHLSDDEGWRIEVPGLPELTELGALRGYTPNFATALYPSFGSGATVAGSPGSGYYTRKDFLEILQYAKERHIEVIPEIDMPGHSRAAIKAMQLRYERKMKEGNKEEAEKYLLHDLKDSSQYMSVQQWKDNVVCPCQNSTYQFFEKVVNELEMMYSEAGVKLQIMHVGGDEVPAGVWTKSPKCQELKKQKPELNDLNNLMNYYFTRINNVLSSKRIQLGGWEEVGLIKTKAAGNALFIPNPEFVDNNFLSYVWNNVWGWGSEDLAYRMANAGYPVVLSNATNLYFDLAYDKWQEEPGYYWAGYCDLTHIFAFAPYDYYRGAREDRMGNPIDPSIFLGKDKLTDFGKQNVKGIQGQLWSENAKNTQVFEYLLLPKLLGLAERAWTPEAEWENTSDKAKMEQLYAADWNRFVNLVGKNELPRLDYYNSGYAYRVPPPGAKRTNGAVEANIQLPGLVIRYTLDGSEPTSASALYTNAIKSDMPVKLRAFDSRGRGGIVVEVK
jgi:hexosaminidase